MYAVRVQSHFSAAHNLRGYRGRCERLHGHNWQVEVQLSARQLNKTAMVCDFKEVKQKLAKVLRPLDHAYLNKLPFFKKNNPTSEQIAEYIYHNLKKLIKGKAVSLSSVSVWETKDSRAIFSAEG